MMNNRLRHSSILCLFWGNFLIGGNQMILLLMVMMMIAMTMTATKTVWWQSDDDDDYDDDDDHIDAYDDDLDDDDDVDGPGLPGSFVASFQVAGARFSSRGAPHLRNLLANDSCECRGALLQEGNGVPKLTKYQVWVPWAVVTRIDYMRWEEGGWRIFIEDGVFRASRWLIIDDRFSMRNCLSINCNFSLYWQCYPWSYDHHFLKSGNLYDLKMRIEFWYLKLFVKMYVMIWIKWLYIKKLMHINRGI